MKEEINKKIEPAKKAIYEKPVLTKHGKIKEIVMATQTTTGKLPP